MINIDYAFDDEIATKFFYDVDNKIIRVYFYGYIDVKTKRRVENECVLIIKNWSSAKSKLGDDTKYYDLDKHLGIFSMIIYAEYGNNNLSLIVNTINDAYIILGFSNPDIEFDILDNLKVQ